MFTEGYSFPHPVLGNADDMSGEFNISFDVVRNENRMILFENINIQMTNEYIKQIISDGFATCLVKIYCSSTLSTWVFEPDKMFEIDENELINKAEIQVYIVCRTEISDYSDQSFNIQYGNEVFLVNKSDVIGISGKITIPIPKADEKLGLGNIFKFHSHQTDWPINFEFHHDKIFINYPVTKDNQHPPNMLFSKVPWTAFNIFIVPAVSGALEYIHENPEDASQWEWFTAIDQLLPVEERSTDYYSDAQLLLKRQLPILSAYNELTEKKLV
jgi:hypothetical protein